MTHFCKGKTLTKVESTPHVQNVHRNFIQQVKKWTTWVKYLNSTLHSYEDDIGIDQYLYFVPPLGLSAACYLQLSIFIIFLLFYTYAITPCQAGIMSTDTKLIFDGVPTLSDCPAQIIPTLYGGDCSTVNTQQHMPSYPGSSNNCYCWLIGQRITFCKMGKKFNCSISALNHFELAGLQTDKACPFLASFKLYIISLIALPCMLFAQQYECIIISITYLFSFVLFTVLLFILFLIGKRNNLLLFTLVFFYHIWAVSVACQDVATFAFSATTMHRTTNSSSTIFRVNTDLTLGPRVEECFSFTRADYRNI